MLAASGTAAWMASAAAWPPERPPAGQRDGAAAQPQAGQSLSAIPAKGGQNADPACAPLLPAATSQLIAAMAQLTLHHARAQARAASPFPSSFPDRESIP
ncbi:MAG: hypothetical protein ACRDND_23195, partial [Streptosporangiaceae bacterium]